MGVGCARHGLQANSVRYEIWEAFFQFLFELGGKFQFLVGVEFDLSFYFVSFQIGDQLVNDRLQGPIVAYVQQRVALVQQGVAYRTIRVFF